jgi:DNA-3-methyladenine glycosylase II
MSSYKTVEEYLSKKDKLLGKIIKVFGEAVFVKEKREAFDALMKAVISQQLSNAASNTITKKIIILHGKRPFKAIKILKINDDLIRSCGVSYSKIKTIKGLAQGFVDKDLSVNKLKKLNDEEVLKKLTSYWGIGTWTSEIFMMFCLKREDVLARNDAGLIRSHKILYPNAKSLEDTAENWRPYRAIAAWYLWKFLDNEKHHLTILNKPSSSNANTITTK